MSHNDAIGSILDRLETVESRLDAVEVRLWRMVWCLSGVGGVAALGVVLGALGGGLR